MSLRDRPRIRLALAGAAVLMDQTRTYWSALKRLVRGLRR